MPNPINRRCFLAACAVATLSSTRGPAHAVGAAFADYPSYFPHWTTREGQITSAMLSDLAPNTIVGMHHSSTLTDVIRILDVPEKHFAIAWYAESNQDETEDDALGLPLAARIAQARARQQVLAGKGKSRYSTMIEIDASRDKADGDLIGESNGADDWLTDAQMVKDAGFTYIAKNLRHSQVLRLRARFGADFVPRLVYEDVTAMPADKNPGYRRDAKEAALALEPITLIIHEGEFGDFPGTPLVDAIAIVERDFDAVNIEAYWGRAASADGFVAIKSFGKRLRPT